MNDTNSNVQFWNHVLYAAEAIETSLPGEARSIALAQMVTLMEAFADQSDPVENFEAFVVLRLCDALQHCLQPAEPGD